MGEGLEKWLVNLWKVPPAMGPSQGPQLQWEGHCDCRAAAISHPQGKLSSCPLLCTPPQPMFFICMDPLSPSQTLRTAVDLRGDFLLKLIHPAAPPPPSSGGRTREYHHLQNSGHVLGPPAPDPCPPSQPSCHFRPSALGPMNTKLTACDSLCLT